MSGKLLSEQLKLEELQIGMEVTTLQLENIKDTYIVLDKVEVIQDKNGCYIKGIVHGIATRMLAADVGQTLFYRSSLEDLEYVSFE